MSRDGRTATLGRIVASHPLFLLRGGLLPHDALLTADDASPLYNEAAHERSTFYAQSWAVVHMLLAGKPSRAKELADYMRLAGDGVAPLEAWRRAFGDFDVNRELERYLRAWVFRTLTHSFPEPIAGGDAAHSAPAAADASAVQAALLRHARADGLESALQRAADDHRSALAQALLGHVWAEAGRVQDAGRLLLAAARDSGDWLVQYYAAVGLTEIVRAEGDRVDAQVRAAALAATKAVLAARPRLVHALMMKADLEDDLVAAAHARALAPARQDYVFVEARLLAQARDVDGAARLLKTLLVPSVPQATQDAARRMLRQIGH